ncbi:MAG: ABC transporter substrate-binding protein [Hyphomicrobiaceae bacterium]
MLKTSRLAVAVIAVLAATSGAQAQTKINYLFPAPPFLPAFSPFQLAQHKGYYKAAGLDVNFQLGKGGADVAKQVGVGNADLGGGIGDTAIIVRANGVNVRGVALLGGRTLTQITARKAANIKSFADLKGKKIGVLAFQDTTYYNLLGVLRSANLGKDDASIQAVGPAGVVKLMISGNLDAISAVPEWTAAIQAAGVEVNTFDIDSVFPAMAQAIIASDETIAKRPQIVKAFVGATLKALAEVMADPAKASVEYVAAVPQHKGKEKAIEGIMRRYNELVYKTANPADLGKFDEARLTRVQKFYVDNRIVSKAVPIKDTYTNQFIGK